MEHLFKLKKGGKTVGLMKIQYGEVYVQCPKSKCWDFQYVSCRGSPEANIVIKFNTAHPFVTKDKNGKDVFVDDKVSFWLIGCPDRATGIIKWQQESHRFVFVEDSSKSEWGFTDKNDIELIEDKEDA